LQKSLPETLKNDSFLVTTTVLDEDDCPFIGIDEEDASGQLGPSLPMMTIKEPESSRVDSYH